MNVDGCNRGTVRKLVLDVLVSSQKVMNSYEISNVILELYGKNIPPSTVKGALRQLMYEGKTRRAGEDYPVKYGWYAVNMKK